MARLTQHKATEYKFRYGS